MIGILVLACSAVFVCVLVLAAPAVRDLALSDKANKASETSREITSGNTMGDPQAPIHMIEYGDYQCPYCLQFWRETEPFLIEEYVNTGKVYFEYRSLGEFLGPESGWAAEGAYCAGDQGKFWEFHDTLFTNWTGENAGDFTPEKLIRYAGTLDLDMDVFKACLEDGKHKGTVERDRLQAEAEGITATPTFIINGRKVEGAQSFQIMKHILDELLNGDIQTIHG